MKHILVAMPFDDTHKAYIEKIGTDCEFRYTTIKTATAGEVKAADIIFGNISPELVKQNDHLEWMQLNSAGSDQYCKPGSHWPGYDSDLCHRCLWSVCFRAYGFHVHDALPQDGFIYEESDQP